MRYLTVRYVVASDCHLELHSFDGTCRMVVFANDGATALAMSPGRAGIDATAIESGFLPRGATHVSRAERGNLDAILAETEQEGSTADPLAEVRLKFSVDLLARRSEAIDSDRDAIARQRQPQAAWRYEAIVDDLQAYHARDGR